MATDARISQEAILALMAGTPEVRVSQVALLVLTPNATVHEGESLMSAVFALASAGGVVNPGSASMALAFDMAPSGALVASSAVGIGVSFDVSAQGALVAGGVAPLAVLFDFDAHPTRTAAALDHIPPYLTEESGPITAYEESGPITATEETGALLLTEGYRNMRFAIIRGSILPALEVAWRKADKTARDLTDATAARLVVSDAYETAAGSLDMNVDLDFVSPKTSGQLIYEWQDGDTDIAAGTYKAQVEADFPDGTAKVEFEFIVRAQVKVPA